MDVNRQQEATFLGRESSIELDYGASRLDSTTSSLTWSTERSSNIDDPSHPSWNRVYEEVTLRPTVVIPWLGRVVLNKDDDKIPASYRAHTLCQYRQEHVVEPFGYKS